MLYGPLNPSLLRHPAESHFSLLLAKNVKIKIYKTLILRVYMDTKVGRFPTGNKYSRGLERGC
jgi:hypothetical protein